MMICRCGCCWLGLHASHSKVCNDYVLLMPRTYPNRSCLCFTGGQNKQVTFDLVIKLSVDDAVTAANECCSQDCSQGCNRCYTLPLQPRLVRHVVFGYPSNAAIHVVAKAAVDSAASEFTLQSRLQSMCVVIIV